MPGLANSVDASSTGFQSLNAATGIWAGRTLTPGSGISITNGTGTGGNPTIASLGTGTSFVLAFKSANTLNATGNTTLASIICDTELFDVGGNYNNATGVFTSPLTGKYLCITELRIGNVGAAHTAGNIVFIVNGTDFYEGSFYNPASVRASSNECTMHVAAIINLVSGDTLTSNYQVSGSTQTITTRGSVAPTSVTYTAISLLS